MQVHITLHVRGFDGRTVHRWAVVDAQGVIRGAGCELTRARALRKANEFQDAAGPDRLLAMLECRAS